MASYSLFRYLKQSDLHAITALETLRRHMGFSFITSLKRYDYWCFKSDQKQDDFFNFLLSGSFEFINPNKHAFYTQKLLSPMLQDQQSLILLKCQLKDAFPPLYQSSFLKEKLADVSYEKALFWEVICDQKTLSEAQVSQLSSLLVNPIFETVNFCDSNEYYV
eukprot:COSAG01_NODE_216_length_21695_cov_83.368772_11_plen_163_part_00